MSLRRSLFGLSLLALPSLAFGGDTVVLSPLLAKGVDPMVVMNVTSLMSSELEYMGDVDGVVELPKSPSSASCISSTSCLSGLASEGGGTKVIAGTITATGGQFLLDLVLYSKTRGRIERHKEFRLDSNPEAVADGMTSVLKELWTGKTPAAEQAAEPSVSSFTAPSGDDDIAFEDDLSDWDPDEEARVEAERKRAEEEERKRAEEAAQARRAEEERRRAEEERARREAEERARREEEDRRREQARREEEERARREAEDRRRAAAQPEPEFDASAISFGDASSEITADEINDAIQFGSTPAPAPVAPAPAPSRTTRVIDDPDEADRQSRMQDLDSEKPAKVDREPAAFTLAVRAGGAKYYGLNFVTAGGEISIALGKSGVAAVIGMETYAAGRQVPVELQPSFNNRTSEWNFLYPLNLGAIYRFDKGGVAVPYVGADIIGASYFQDPQTEIAGLAIDGQRYNTVGARGRLGVDLMFTANFGLNVNAAIGGWTGKRWPVIDRSTKAGGLLPQISAGALAAF